MFCPWKKVCLQKSLSGPDPDCPKVLFNIFNPVCSFLATPYTSQNTEISIVMFACQGIVKSLRLWERLENILLIIQLFNKRVIITCLMTKARQL